MAEELLRSRDAEQVIRMILMIIIKMIHGMRESTNPPTDLRHHCLPNLLWTPPMAEELFAV